MSHSHTRIVQHPIAHLMQEARLDEYHERPNEIILEAQGFQVVSSKLVKRKGIIAEKVTAKYIPLTLTFSNVSKLKRDKFFTALETYPKDDISRTIAYMFSWIQPKKRDTFYMFGLRGPANADIQFFARGFKFETNGAPGKSFTVERIWSPSPPMKNGLVPQPKAMHRQFGGDPVTTHIKQRSRSQRLFIGGIEIQPETRPQVDAVLNLGETPSRWVKKGKPLHPNDRAIEHGEGSQGMNLKQIREEATWVIERLLDDKRVLVHCVAGMNRSATVCCAVLILMEGLSAEDSLDRIRERHPWARPDSHHWLMLRWLAEKK